MGIVEWVIIGAVLFFAWVFWDKRKLEKQLGKKITWDEYSALQKQEKEQPESEVDEEIAAIRRMGGKPDNTENSGIKLARTLTDMELSNARSSSQNILSLQTHLPKARQAHDQGNYDQARSYYQKAGYANHRTSSSSLKNAVLHEQTEFAKQDPMYRKIVNKVKRLLKEKDVIKQTDLYTELHDSRENIQYVLYFAEQKGDLVRKKKGRTYNISRW